VNEADEQELRELRFKVGDALPADDPLARFILVVSMGLNHNSLSNRRFVDVVELDGRLRRTPGNASEGSPSSAGSGSNAATDGSLTSAFCTFSGEKRIGVPMTRVSSDRQGRNRARRLRFPPQQPRRMRVAGVASLSYGVNRDRIR
jgi:hypothetical protein